MFGNQSSQKETITVRANQGEPGARRDLNTGFGKPGSPGATVRYVKDIPNPNYRAPAAAAAPAAAPAPAPPPLPPPVVEQPKVAFDSTSYAASTPETASASSPQGGPASPFQVIPPKEEQRKPFVADTEARDYDHFVKGLEKINPPEATSSESSRGSDAGGMRFAASQKFRDGINERLGIKDQMNDTETDDDEDDDAYSWRQERNGSSFSRGLS